MKDILRLQQKIVPELIELLEKRYNILRTIYYNAPIGRRLLATKLDIGERVVRTEIDFLKSQNLIDINTPGMTVTKDGEEILESLKEFIHEIKGLSDIEEQVRSLLNIKKVIIVPGDAEEDYTVIKELGKAAANYSKGIIGSGDIIALTGGSTVKEVIDNFPKIHNINNILVVPARGGMGKKVETQANTLAGRLAQKLNGTYKMLHVPENLSEDILETLVQQKEINDVIQSIHNANVLIYGIGRADNMARKRGLSEENIKKLTELGAVGEAFGCYFNSKAEVVYVTPTVGINIKDVNKISTHIAVAGGKNKVEAIIATEMNKQNAVLVTDEGVAEKIIEILKQNV